jgi:hypothetical protein
MRKESALEISVVLPFADDEDVIGTACRRVAAHLREMGVGFEVLAIDEDSGDNSHAILTLLRAHIPELRIVAASGAGRGFDLGAGQARGRVLWLIEPRAAALTLAPVGRAYRRVVRGELDLAVVDRRFAVCHRTRCLPILQGARFSGFRRLTRRARGRRLQVESYEIGGSRPRIGRLGERPWQRLLEAFSPARSAPSGPDRSGW